METQYAREFAEIYNREADAVFRFCLIRTSDRDMALDFTQDTFMRFWSSLLTGKKINNSRTFLIHHRPKHCHRLVSEEEVGITRNAFRECGQR